MWNQFDLLKIQDIDISDNLKRNSSLVSQHFDIYICYSRSMYRKFNKEEQEKEDLRININPNKQNKNNR